MSNYPTLTEMGIQNPDQIVRYSTHLHNNVDHLRIIYKRKSGSLLPVTRRYQFGRASKMVATDSGTNTYETVYEISPFLLKAFDELDQIINKQHDDACTKQLIEEEIQRIESEMNAHINHLKDLVKRL